MRRFSSKLLDGHVIEAVYRAIQFWSDVTDIKFYEKLSGDVDIPIDFVTFDHGDGNPFDGVGGALAHAYYPENGDIHVDDSETWTVDSHLGSNFLQTLTHEIGHSIGLEHSSVRNAVMFPNAGHYNEAFQLHQDDISKSVHSFYSIYKHMFQMESRVCMVTRKSPQPDYINIKTSLSTHSRSRKGIPSFSCPDIGFNTRDKTDQEMTENVESWQECFGLCRQRSGCRYWTWHHENAGPYSFRCITMEDVYHRVRDDNAISGKKKCY